MDAIFVLFHFRKKGELSYDARLRYHIARVRQELQEHNLVAIVLLAEVLLLKKQGRGEEMKRYMASYSYRLNVLKEKLILLFVDKDTRHLIQKWRKFWYR